MLLQLQNSPLSKSPINLDHIPGISKLNSNEQKPKTVVKDSSDDKVCYLKCIFLIIMA